jgi:hypothetical protein
MMLATFLPKIGNLPDCQKTSPAQDGKTVRRDNASPRELVCAGTGADAFHATDDGTRHGALMDKVIRIRSAHYRAIGVVRNLARTEQMDALEAQPVASMQRRA